MATFGNDRDGRKAEWPGRPTAARLLSGDVAEKQTLVTTFIVPA